MKILVLGLGNELISDDAVGIIAVRKLGEKYKGRAEIEESSLSGLALMDIFVGYDKAIVIDAVCSGRKPPGTIYELTSSDLGRVLAPSPHYTGLPEMMALAAELSLEFPGEIKIFAVEVSDMHSFGGDLTLHVKKALDPLLEKVELQLDKWEGNQPHA
jgi:hydrogenase maturation protease